MKCTVCGGALEDGFIPDVASAQILIAIWVSGEPTLRKGFWERVRTGMGINLDGVEAKAIEAKRCRSCGHLELFANEAPDKYVSLARPPKE